MCNGAFPVFVQISTETCDMIYPVSKKAEGLPGYMDFNGRNVFPHLQNDKFNIVND